MIEQLTMAIAGIAFGIVAFCIIKYFTNFINDITKD